MGINFKSLRIGAIAALLISCTSLPDEPPIDMRPFSISPNVSFGRDFYALQSQYWNVKNANMYPMVQMSTGNLDNTFGADLTKVDLMLAVLRPVFHRVHIINTTCVRNGNCGKYEIGYGYNKQTFNNAIKNHNKRILSYVLNRTTLYKNLSAKYTTTLIVSPALEHDLDHDAWEILADTVLTAWPNVQLANSPDAGINILPYKGALIERHGPKFPLDADIVSLDGFDATDIDIGAFNARVIAAPHVKIALDWIMGDNCRVKQWIDPRERKNCPSKQTFELVTHVNEPLPNAPSFTGNQCKKVTPFKSPDIWKPLAESYANVKDPRQELPVMITGGFGKSDVTLLSSNGVKVGTLGFYGAFGKQFRWYSGYKNGSHASGYEFQKRAVMASNSPYIWAMQNGSCRGPFVPGRRAGASR